MNMGVGITTMFKFDARNFGEKFPDKYFSGKITPFAERRPTTRPGFTKPQVHLLDPGLSGPRASRAQETV